MSPCPICNSPIISPSGDKSSVILIVGQSPTEEDMSIGKALSGEYRHILRGELANSGIDFFRLRATSMWLHPAIKGKRAGAVEREWHFQQMIKEAIGKKAILLLGSEGSQFFFKKSATELSGIPMKSEMLSADLVMCARDPLDVVQGFHGEFILAIRKFCDAIKKGGYYV